MKKYLFFTALLLLACLCVSSCSSSIALHDGQTITVRYFNQGKEVANYKISGQTQIVLPEIPKREGYKFNGWWVTNNNGVVEFDKDWLKRNSNLSYIEVNARWINTSYILEQLSWGTPGNIQDGTILKGLLFKFDNAGLCYVFDTSSGKKIGGFMLDKADEYKPHSNAVCFGNQYYDRGDEFPLLYANIYNNYNKDQYTDKMAGTVCVYRIQRTDSTRFKSTLVQIINIDFANNEPWRSEWNEEQKAFTDRSPWGNFIVDTDNSKLWAFVTRDHNQTTRFFCFDLPVVSKGSSTESIILKTSNIERYFDVPYAWYLQGACYRDGKIYSTEGMGTDENPTRIRVIDLEKGIEDSVVDLYSDKAYMREAEFIDFQNEVCWYGDYKKINSNPTAFLYNISGI